MKKESSTLSHTKKRTPKDGVKKNNQAGRKNLEVDEFTKPTKLDQDIPEEFRQPIPNELPAHKANTTNWSAPEDRGEDLINERDPYLQQPELNSEIPPELIQERAYHLYEQRGASPDGNLSDWFEAERQLRQEKSISRR